MYELYKFDATNTTNPVPKPYDVRVCKLSMFRLSIPCCGQTVKRKLFNLYFYLISKGTAKIYYVCDGDRVIHRSYCMQKSFKFQFMKKGDIYIGPCITEKNYRGQGIYPYVISEIVKNCPQSAIYVIIHEKNHSSQRGISKVGFKKIAALEYHKIKKTFSISERRD